ncbi:MAG TPA: class I SAM-dependent methyltransferase [Deltaproteobacteria bacterium]|nr:class I SAM-dependent methyltransferase [Deltaproteobacteria bacterium]
MTSQHSSIGTRPEIMTRGESHRKVLHIFRKKPKGKLLDIPCGQGALAQELTGLGFDVSCCDIDSDLFLLDKSTFRQGNMNQKLPYENSSFDYIACIAGLHRIHRFEYAISEFHRLLVPGGELIVSFPNYSNMERRVKFLLTGSVSKVVNQMAIHKRYTDDPDALFRQILIFPQVYFALKRNDFDLLDFCGDKIKYRSLLFLWPMGVLMKLFYLVASRDKKDNQCLGWTSSFTMLFGGNNIILTARKSF